MFVRGIRVRLVRRVRLKVKFEVRSAKGGWVLGVRVVG